MKQDVFMSGRDYEAKATYIDGKMIVYKGSQIKDTEVKDFKHSERAFALRKDKEYVQSGYVIKDCEFDSPSTAAQFISGGSRNGYDTWRVRKGYTLGQFLQDKGIRERKVRTKEQ